MTKYLVMIATDCGGTDRGRYEIETELDYHPEPVKTVMFETTSLSTLHAGFVGTAHALSTVDGHIERHGPLAPDLRVGLIINAAPERDDIYALRLTNGVEVVGPHLGFNFFFLQDRIEESFLVHDRSGRDTPFRSMEVMIPALAKRQGIGKFPHIEFEPKTLERITPKPGLFVADWDVHGNLYLASTKEDDSWIPKLGETQAFHIGDQVARLRRVDGIFKGERGEAVLTTGSLRLNGKNVNYIVVRGGRARDMFGSPAVGTEVVIE